MSKDRYARQAFAVGAPLTETLGPERDETTSPIMFNARFSPQAIVKEVRGMDQERLRMEDEKGLRPTDFL